MAHKAEALRIEAFNSSPFLDSLKASRQIRYLKCYLKDLDAKSIIIEPHYFDKDYLSEFANFYSMSSHGYPNSCKRIHFFSCDITRDKLEKAIGESQSELDEIQNSYRGFAVIRPITSAPLGSTVLSWYPDQSSTHPRVRATRNYEVHIAGIKLNVRGLSWQQQDTGVGACATIALWSALHSSAFDEYHAIPTTAQITLSATKNINLGRPVFPNSGLNTHQICDAIKEIGLTPMILTGDRPRSFFSKERFSSNCASFIRAGYPVIALGLINGSGHAICITGFREAKSLNLKKGEVNLSDSEIETLYMHDDNLGPNVRALLKDDTYDVHIPGDPNPVQTSRVAIKAEGPPPGKYSTNRTKGDDPTSEYFDFYPDTLIVAVHNEIRTSADHLNSKALLIAQIFNIFINPDKNNPSFPLTASATIMELTEYIGTYLHEAFPKHSSILSKVRLELWEKVPPMSYHLGIIRIGNGSQKFMDIIFDTTDTDRNHPVYATIAYSKSVKLILDAINQHRRALEAQTLYVPQFGNIIEAY